MSIFNDIHVTEGESNEIIIAKLHAAYDELLNSCMEDILDEKPIKREMLISPKMYSIIANIKYHNSLYLLTSNGKRFFNHTLIAIEDMASDTITLKWTVG